VPRYMTAAPELDIDEELFMKAWRLSSLKTKKAFFEEMLRMYARLHEQAGVQSLRGKLVWDGDLSKVREKHLGLRVAWG
jgi:Arc/MetJ family transcription regulator